MAPRVRVLPVVYFSIIDHYLRRNDQQTRVIGTLLGTVNGQTIEVTNCFPVPHNENDDQVAVDVEYQSNMRALYAAVNPNEVVVGWYATGPEVTEHSMVIQDIINEEATNPVHLCIDTSLQNKKMGIQAMISSPMGAPDGTQGRLLSPIECDVLIHEPERVALSMLDKSLDEPDSRVPLISDLDHVTEATVNLQEMIAKALTYVTAVTNGEQEGDERIGRYLRDTVAAIPKVDPVKFEGMFNDTVQDLLMVGYLSNLAQSQVTVQEKLNDILIPDSSR
eukprot:TRINITY_DN4290_c0_g1_i2.p1 TRINITY_DN4290_c0_g1~~TRINITY_DN4290_c0_g1_i2.p1  ORF type:complete len:295 (+),score=73.83 TRINITY_DN4290_c0_g1_i2:54-887(+)